MNLSPSYPHWFWGTRTLVPEFRIVLAVVLCNTVFHVKHIFLILLPKLIHYHLPDGFTSIGITKKNPQLSLRTFNRGGVITLHYFVFFTI